MTQRPLRVDLNKHLFDLILLDNKTPDCVNEFILLNETILIF